MSTPLLATTPTGDLLSVVLSCVCAALRDHDRPACTCCVTHSGSVFPADGADCECEDGTTGRVSGRIVQIAAAPSNQVAPTSNCMGGMVEVTLQIAVMRCWPLADEGSALSCDEQTAEALNLLADEQIMRAAVACCSGLDTTPGRWELTPGQSNPYGPQGGIAGWILSVNAYGQLVYPKTTRRKAG